MKMDKIKSEIIIENDSVPEYAYKNGMARIKPQYIKIIEQSDPIKPVDDPDISEPSAKKQKIKGMNRKRNIGHIPNQKSENFVVKICPYIKSSQVCPYEEKCRYEHNIEAAVSEKKSSMTGDCYNYIVRGFCPMGMMCLWSASHLNEEGVNMVDEKIKNEYIPVSNILSKDLLTDLRKKKYDFDLSYNALDNLKISYGGKKDSGKNHIKKECSEKMKINGHRDVSTKRTVDWSNKLYLAPLTTVGNLPFRRICKEWGADITCSEMAMATKLIQGVQSEWALLKRHPTEDVFGVQVCGAHPEVLTKCAQMINESCKLDFIDVNCGCPLDLVCDKGEGCGLLRNKKRLENIVAGMSAVVDCPITVKTRIGYGISERSAHLLLPRLHAVGAAMVTVHGRTKEQRYTRQADWQYVGECVSAASPMPVFGNGDILSWEDYEEQRSRSGVTGVMVGRGALIKPWLFTEIKERHTRDISSSERLDIIKKYASYGLEYWGSDYRGLETTRKFLLEWMSFLHRYIPVGLLERPPQRINERPPLYVGRDDLETLMISDNCADWVRLTEMVLGPVPDNFQFVPKHRAHAY